MKAEQFQNRAGRLPANASGVKCGPSALAVWWVGVLVLVSASNARSQPVFTLQPADQSVSIGAKVTFQAYATGTPPLSYQWQHDAHNLAGETGHTLVLTNIQLADAGAYTVVVTNLEGSVTSQPAVLDVDPTFTKVTSDPIVNDSGYDWHGQAWGDFDNDGDQDVLLLTDRQGWDPLYLNNGDGTFTRSLEPSFEQALDQGVSAFDIFYSCADYDNDGHLDLFVPDWSAFFGQSGKNLLFHNNGQGAFTPVTDSPPAMGGAISTYGSWGDYDRDGDLDLVVANGGAAEIISKNWFYRNEGGGAFTKVLDTAQFPFLAQAAYYVVPQWVDVNGDGWQDLFILVWPSGVNHLYLNTGEGGFTEVTGDPLVSESSAWGASAWADYDNDGDLDVFITFASPSSTSSATGPFRLYRNDGGGHFTSMSAQEVGPLLSEGSQSLSCAWGDYDNDGWIDLYVANGWLDEGTRPDLLYRNNGDGTFTKITRGSPATEKGAGLSANWVDINGDGFLDIFVAKRPQPDNSLNRLYRNNGNSNSWLCVKCDATVSPRWGTGAKVRVKATINGKPMWQLRLIDAGGWAWGGQSFVAHFGLGDATVVDTLRIEWTSGIVQELHNVPVKQYLTVTEPPRLDMPQPGQLEVHCWRGEAVGLEQSSDLQTWTPPVMVTNLSASGAVQWTDPDSPGPAARFYRAVRQ